MFSNKDLKNLILPLFLEQLLTIFVGLADTFVISFVGESAVSGVSLVNSFNTIFIFLFTALAGSEWRGAGDFRVCQGGAQQHRRFVRNLSDSGKRNCAEHLVQRCIGLRDDGTGVYHGDRAVYGCGRRCEIYGFHDKGYGVSKAGV